LLDVSADAEKFAQFLQRPPHHLSFSDDEMERIRLLPVVERSYDARTLLMEEEGTRPADLFIASGWAISYKSMSNGQRVVTDFLQRGDLVSGNAVAGKVYRSVETTTDVRTFEIQRPRLAAQPRPIADVMIRLMARNFDIAGEHFANVARRPPLERLAFLLLEVAHRNEQSGLGSADRYDFPFTQRDLADALGLTAIHINRLLRVLRERQLLSFRHWTVELTDRRTLHEMTLFDPSYLDLDAHYLNENTNAYKAI
jgi:CRP-like cAMP-binding protein